MAEVQVLLIVITIRQYGNTVLAGILIPSTQMLP